MAELQPRGKHPPRPSQFPGSSVAAPSGRESLQQQQVPPPPPLPPASAVPLVSAGEQQVSSLQIIQIIIDKAVDLHSWLVGSQQKLLLGIGSAKDGGAKGGAGGERGDGCSSGYNSRSKRHQQQQQQHLQRGCTASSSFKRRNAPSRARYHRSRLVAVATDFSQRASFDRGFLSWAYASRLLVSGGFFLVALYLNALATMVATHRNPYAMMLDRSGEPLSVHTLPDLGHDLWAFFLNRLGHHTDYIDEHALPDRMVSLAGALSSLFIVCHPHRLKICRRVFTIFGTVLLMRAVSVSVTVLPDASPACRQRLEEDAAIAELFPWVFLEAARFVLSPTSFVTCGDMVFSGHTTCLMMVAMTFRKYCRAQDLQTKVFFTGFHLSERSLWVVRRAVYAYVGLGSLVIIGSKLHYTLDVLLAVLITFCTFAGYHSWAGHELLRKNVTILDWLESDGVREQDDIAYSMAKRP